MDFKKKKDRKPKKETGLLKKNFAIESCDVVTFHETKQRRQKKKERERKNLKKAKKKDKEERKNKRERERERETEKEKLNKRQAKKRLRRNKGRHPKINKKCLFLGGNRSFCNEKQRKGKKQENPKKNKTNKQKNK